MKGRPVWHSRPRLCLEQDIVGGVSTRRDTRDGDIPPTICQHHSRGRLCHMHFIRLKCYGETSSTLVTVIDPSSVGAEESGHCSALDPLDTRRQLGTIGGVAVRLSHGFRHGQEQAHA